MERIYLDKNEIPKQWYNIMADLPEPMVPPISPATGQPATFEEMQAIFPPALIEQEMSTQRWFDIPEEVMDILSIWRPSPLMRATRLEKLLGTPAKIYFKYEGVSPAGSHKTNTAVPQAYYNLKHGIKKLSTETGAGQWGSALSYACAQFEMECRVFMVKVSYHQKPYRKSFMKMFGAEVIPSPSELTNAGRAMLAKNPDSNGSLGLAISEAVEEAASRADTNYALGSVLNHVCLHQTVIGLEAKKQLEKVNEYPDVVYASCGGGSNFAGIAFPFVQDKINGKDIEAIAVEPSSCPTLTKGQFAYDYGDVAKLTPIMKMYTLGHDFEPPAIHSGGLRYHGDSPIVSHLYKHGLVGAQSVPQLDVFKYGTMFAKEEGIIPAPESAHAVAAVVHEALRCKEAGEEKTILFCLSGHGHFDMTSYESYMEGKLEDYEYPEAAIKDSLERLPEVK
ncbi:TrpB-like pyridoxal phosphate-dependent enzyme [Limisalsivibrio acetivorans]|uniref:TrpB-like pyridoxal phosphate-dependent enzyme n=1 Tax=Limisalsivibrio acetivorans TaxID=1304888 RepID=UPI0003B59297|nr:TrpB-like pyridoxal phosphate-dependent enzyme [Limisalsivibrio acetivorans]